jgi:hypothetical protein
LIDSIGLIEIGTSLAQCSNAFGDQEFKRHFVPFKFFAVFSIPALLRSVQKRSQLLKSAYLGLKIERSEVLEFYVVDSRQSIVDS